MVSIGGETILVGRPGFKPGGWRHAPPGGFDSRSPPPSGACRARLTDVVVVAGFVFPDGLHYQPEDQVWARREADGQVTVGITPLGVHQAGGEIYMCRPKGVGHAVERGRAIAVVEVAKAVLAVKSPLSGMVVAVNEALAARPERVHEDPCGEGWIARVAPSDWPADAARLVSGEAVAPVMRRLAWLDGLVAPADAGEGAEGGPGAPAPAAGDAEGDAEWDAKGDAPGDAPGNAT